MIEKLILLPVNIALLAATYGVLAVDVYLARKLYRQVRPIVRRKLGLDYKVVRKLGK